ncbi:MAG: exodeoxyribonuclease III [Gammaproteobacteria bacterium]|nr:exodeoxyribonuclease III [Gammaproteobacteria bacterium]
MKIASWNVNSLKVRLPQVLDWLKQSEPDVLAIQEIKLTDENFPVAEIKAAGYEVVYSGQKTYNGVAVLARQPLTDIVTDIPGLEDPQRRILAATIGPVRVLNLYVVNGQEVGSEKFAYKLRWLSKVKAYIQKQLSEHNYLVVLGDFNIAPEDRDVYDPELWREKILCSSQERGVLGEIMALGLKDTFRYFESGGEHYSWWDYRAAGFRRNLGLRIDLILANDALMRLAIAAGIDREPRGWERPSDHTPAWAEFNISN